MRSSFFGLELARRAMTTHRTNVDVIGHNLANVHTEGYRKQEAVLTPTNPYSLAGTNRLEMGTGVQVQDISRRQSRYLDREIYRRQGESAYWENRGQLLSEIEDILAEPGDSGIGAVMDQFWNCWQDLAAEPDSAAMRTAVIERGQELGDAFRMSTRQLENMMGNLEQTAASRVDRINSILSELQELDERVRTLHASDAIPSDLLDRRDVLVERLGELVDVQVRDTDGGGVRVTVDGIPVLDSYSGRRLEVQAVGAGGGGGEDGAMGFSWAREGDAGDPIEWEPSTVGELGSLVQMRNEDVPRMLSQLRELADGIRDGVNVVHSEGVTLDGDGGGEFFASEAGPGFLQVSEDITSNPKLIAAGGPEGEGDYAIAGDGRNALRLSDLRNDGELVGGSTPGEYLRSLVADLGIRAEQADQQHGNNHVMLSQLLNQRDALTGVSIDEEMTHLIQAQNAFNASARLVRVWDEMLDIVVNGLVR